MSDYKNSVIITGLRRDVREEDIIKYFKRIGEIKKNNIKCSESVTIVTYADSKAAELAVKELDGKEINGNVIKVQLADKLCNGDNFGFGGGTDGKRGASNRPAAINQYKGKVSNEWNGELTKNLKNKNEWGSAAKGGKGGVGVRNVPNGHDGEDGDPGPGGKGGAGGRPAISKNPYELNGCQTYDPWYTRWFGIGGYFKGNEKVESNSSGEKGEIGGEEYRKVPSAYNSEGRESGPGDKGGAGGRPTISGFEWTGAAKGGKGGTGSRNVPNGNDGEDAEPGPGGKGGAGGRPAVSKNPYIWNGNWNDLNEVPWYTRWFGIGKCNKKTEQDISSPVGEKGGMGGDGYNNVPFGQDGENGEAGPSAKGGAGGKSPL